MPDNVPTPAAQPAPAAPSSTLPGTTNGVSAGASPAPQWRAPDGAPGWAKGKTAEEILGIADTLVDMYNKGGAPRAVEPPAPAPVAAPIADDEYITGAHLKQILASVAASGAPTVELAASASLGSVRQQYAQDFAKYGQEIYGKLSRVPKNLWTLDNLETVVKLVRSDHLDEIAEERANTRFQQLASGTESTLRSNGAAGSIVPITREHSLESEKIPAEWKRRAQENGVTERAVEEFCRGNDMTPEAFYKQFDKPLNRIVEDHGKRPNA